MQTALFDFHLPEELIATRPPEQRDGGRLCIVEEEGVRHSFVRELGQEVRAGDLVVLNETRVRKARLFCSRPQTNQGGGARVEILFLHPAGANRWIVLGRSNRPLRPEDRLEAPGLSLRVVERAEQGTLLVEVEGDLERVLEEVGQMPIPPYLHREADAGDDSRYQTVFAQRLGSAAAPTAGLHLTESALSEWQARGVEVGRLTLHVGMGTFRPVSADDLDDHPMHEESFSVSEELVEQVARTRARGGRVCAIGTTVVRALESAADPEERGRLRAMQKQTAILIQPGYEFRVVDALLTNFHLPKSTLLALVSAFAGRERVLAVYEEAVRQKYRFLSYGDAMWIPRRMK